MDIEKVHPELRGAVGRVRNPPVHNRVFLSVINVLMKWLGKTKTGEGVAVTEHQLGRAEVKVYRPANRECSGGALLWIHGGGLVLGAPEINNRECGAYARDLGLIVVSVKYRLAPKHPFPAALDDCFEVWRWLQSNAEKLGVDASRVVISGQSAGGGLAAALALRIRDEGGIQPAGQALLCPMLDDRTAANRELDDIEHLVWNNRSNRAGWSFYLGQPAGAVNVPCYAAPARCENLVGLPPTWIAVGDIDLFFEEDKRYAERLREAGISCHLEVIPGAPHGFEILAYDSSPARIWYDSNYRFLREVLELPAI